MCKAIATLLVICAAGFLCVGHPWAALATIAAAYEIWSDEDDEALEAEEVQ